jgi:hypothetical protein
VNSRTRYKIPSPKPQNQPDIGAQSIPVVAARAGLRPGG